MRAPGILLHVFAVVVAGSLLQAQAPPSRAAAPPKATPAAAKPTPAPAPVIEGLVRGPDRKPVDKALVIAVVEAAPQPRWQTGDLPVTARTGPDGRFRLTLRRARTQTVRVEASGLAAATRKDVSPGASLTIDLTKGGTIEGLVRDGETGQPVPQAKVTAAGTQSIPVPDDPDAGRVVAMTDAAGRFKLEGLASGLHTVTARSRLAGYASLPNVRLGARVELLVFPAATLSGTVVGPAGRPVPRAVVSANGRRPLGRAATSETADDLGRYELNGLAAGTYDVIARAPGFAPAVAAEVALERRSDAHVDLTLRPGVRVVGRLVDADERPVPGRVGVGELDGRMTPFALVESLRGEALADGRFRIDDVPVGEHALGVAAPGFAAERVDFSARASDRQVDVGDVHLDVGLAIRGRVRTRSGAPVAEAAIRAFAMRRGLNIVEAQSQADGSFTLAGLEQVVYNIGIQAPGFGAEDKQAEPGGDPLDVILDPAGTVTGQVVDDRGRPIESFSVSATPGRGSGLGPRMRMMPRGEEFTAEDGRFTIGDLAAGTYVVQATAPERAGGSVPGVAVSAGATVDVGAIKLPQGGVVKGLVADASGGPVAGARVTVSGQGQNWMSTGDEPQALSDGAGAFEVKGISAGRAQVVASHPNYARSEAVATEVDPAKPAADLRLVLTQGGRVEGSVRRRDGTPLPSLLVNARGTGGIDFGASFRETSATTGPDGSFAIEHVRPGRGTLSVMPSGPGGVMSSVLRREYEVRDGETTSVDLVLREILISGHVTRGGGPAAGLRIEARASSQFTIGSGPNLNTPPAPTSGPQRMLATTRDDGGYEMIVDEPGTVNFAVTSADGRSRLPMRSAEVPDADAFTFDMAFGGAPVTGMVVDKETEAPVGYAYVSARRLGDGPPGIGNSTSGPDGRFHLEVDPGEYLLHASTRDGGDYGPAEQRVSISEAGLSDVRLALPKGLSIAGKVTDAAGRPVPWVYVQALSSEGRGAWGGQSLADGSFSVPGLKAGAYTVIAEAEAGSFAIRPGVAAGTKAVSLTLEPGGRLLVAVEGPDGQPIPGAWPTVSHVGGLLTPTIGRLAAPTDSQGATEMVVPAGDLTIEVSKNPLRGGTNVTVAPGQTERVRIVLRPGKPEALRR